MAETKEAIVAASNLPLSIIIVGVGNEDFRAMEALDSDKQALKSGQDVASRDIVQFVELRKFFVAQSYNRERLAQQVLAEVPKQLVSWMTKRGVKPLYAWLLNGWRQLVWTKPFLLSWFNFTLNYINIKLDKYMIK